MTKVTGESSIIQLEKDKTRSKCHKWQFKAVCRHIGKANLPGITPETLDNMHITMLKGDTPSGSPSSGSCVNQIHNIALMFDQTIKEGVLARNPLRCGKSAQDGHQREEDDETRASARPHRRPRPFSAQRVRVPHGHHHGNAPRGDLRPVAGNVDFDRRIVDVSHSFDSLNNLKETKTEAGMRLPRSRTHLRSAPRAEEGSKETIRQTNSFRKPEEGYLIQDGTTPVISTPLRQARDTEARSAGDGSRTERASGSKGGASMSRVTRT